jgi:putative aminopeptidase FrvX
MDFTHQLLKELTEANGVPGYEAPVRAVRLLVGVIERLTAHTVASFTE